MSDLEQTYSKITENVFAIDSNQTEFALDVIFRYWRERGFPHYTNDIDERFKQLEKLRNYDVSHLEWSGTIMQTMHGLAACWYYFPHWVEVACGSSKMAPIDYWNDDIKLKAIILKTWKWHLKHGSGKFTTNRLLQNFKIYGGNQSVSNFRPSVAKWIYNKWANDGAVWDMSSGWGGRLFGFLASNAKLYIGTEPSTKTYEGLLKMASELGSVYKKIEIHKIGSENFIPDAESLDLCFTSPPYLDTEKYSEEETQSYIKYPDEESWWNGFFKQTISNCKWGLKPEGKLILNIANTSKYKDVEAKVVEICTNVGFRMIARYNLTLSSVSGKGSKYEPIFVFEKHS